MVSTLVCHLSDILQGHMGFPCYLSRLTYPRLTQKKIDYIINYQEFGAPDLTGWHCAWEEEPALCMFSCMFVSELCAVFSPVRTIAPPALTRCAKEISDLQHDAVWPPSLGVELLASLELYFYYRFQALSRFE